MKKKICGWIAFLCFVRMVGIAGSSDLELISFAESVAQTIPALALMLISSKIGGII